MTLIRAKGFDVYLADSVLDERFLQILEQNETVKFVRVDAGIDAIREETEEENEQLTALFASLVPEGKKMKVALARFTDESVPAILTVSEESRRMEEMMRMYAPDMPSMDIETTITLNVASPVVKRLAEGGFGDKNTQVAKHVLSLATLAHRPLSADEMKEFLSGSYDLLVSLS